MNAKTLKALKLTVAHWTRLATGKRRKNESIYAENCALCKMFLVKYDCSKEECLGCPVAENTGHQFCQRTPWYNAKDAKNEFGIKSVIFKSAAKKQLAFLTSLLPKKK